MEDARARLARSFAAVFPDLGRDEIERATPETVGAWDSIANVTLITVVEEEFGVEIPVDELASLASFESLLEYLRGATNAA